MNDATPRAAAPRGVTPPVTGARSATKAQRSALLVGLAISLLFCLWLFQGILTPFVLAATIAYFLDPLATRLTRLGLPRSLAAFSLLLLLAACTLVALLLLYPLIVTQIGVLVQRLPAYIAGIVRHYAMR